MAACRSSPSPMWRLMAGKIAVPIADPTRASGSWFKRSAWLRYTKLPSGSRVAK
jgi:hypothetical protein